MPLFVAYHGLDFTSHQSRVNELAPQGYRLISLSVSGDPSDARYAAVWAQRPGPDYIAFHGRSAGDYQNLVDTWKGQGYAPVLLSATGGPGDEIFAGVFERLTIAWRARHGMSPANFDSESKQAAADGFIMRELVCYGTLSNPLFAAIWHENPSNIHVSWWRDFDRDGYQQVFNAVSRGGGRPYLVTTSDGPRYHAIFQDDDIGFWTTRHGISDGEYQTEFDENLRQGRMPISARAFGRTSSSAQDLYNAVFANDDQENTRLWVATGVHSPPFDPVENVIRSFMAKHRIHAGSLAIGRGGDVLCSRGFTLAEEGYPVTPPDALFRLASLSKLFASAAIRTAFASVGMLGRVNWRSIQIFPLLGITSPRLAGQTPDVRTDTITLGHLIDHQGGWNRDTARPSLHVGQPVGFDPCSGPMLRLIARDIGLTHVVSKMDVASYMFGEPLQFTPGTSPQFVYSNLGYLLLGLAIEKRSAHSFIDYLRETVLAPISVTDVFVADSLKPAPREVRYHSIDAVSSVFAPHLDPAWVSPPYGGLSTEVNDSSGGLLASAPSVVRAIATHAVWGIGSRAVGSSRIGSMPGSFTCASSRGNGYDYAVLFNGNDGLNDAIRSNFLSEINGLIDALV